MQLEQLPSSILQQTPFTAPGHAGIVYYILHYCLSLTQQIEQSFTAVTCSPAININNVVLELCMKQPTRICTQIYGIIIFIDTYDNM